MINPWVQVETLWYLMRTCHKKHLRGTLFISVPTNTYLYGNVGWYLNICVLFFASFLHYSLWKFNSHFESSTRTLKVQLALWKFNSHFESSTRTLKVQLALWKFNSHFESSTRTLKVQLALWKFNSHFESSTRTLKVQLALWKFNLQLNDNFSWLTSKLSYRSPFHREL